MAELLPTAARLAVLVFVATCMAAAGLGLGVRDLVGPLRRGRLLARAVVANFVVAPAVAVALTRVVPLNPDHATGLLLVGGAAGAPFLPKLAAVARADAAFAVGLTLVLIVGSVAYMPVVLPLLIPGLAADPWPMLRSLLLTMLLPLAAGMAVRAWAEGTAVRLRPMVEVVSNVSMVLAVVLLTALNFGDMVATAGSGAALTAMVFVAVSLAAGYLLGGPSPDTRAVVGLGTGQRNVAAALVVATQNAAPPGVVVMILIATLAGLVVLLAAAVGFARPRGPTGDREAVRGGSPVATAPTPVDSN